MENEDKVAVAAGPTPKIEPQTTQSEPQQEPATELVATDRIVVLEQKVADIFASEGRIVALEKKVAELEQRKPAEPVGEGASEGRLAELESKVAKFDEFLIPHGYNRVIPEVVEPQCQSEIPEPQPE